MLGVVSLLLALSSFATRPDGSAAPDISYSLGTLVPSVLLLTAGIWLVRNSKARTGESVVPLRSAKKWPIVVLGCIGAFVVGGAVLGAVFGEDDATPRERLETSAASTLQGYIDGTQGVRGTGPGFSAVFPGEPAKDSSVEKARDGQDFTMTSLIDEVGGTAFAVQYSDFGPNADLSLPRLVLRSAAEGGATAVGGKLAQFKQTTVEGRPAAFALISGEVNSRLRLIIDGQRLIVLQVYSTDANARGFTRFVQSFRFD